MAEITTDPTKPFVVCRVFVFIAATVDSIKSEVLVKLRTALDSFGAMKPAVIEKLRKKYAHPSSDTEAATMSTKKPVDWPQMVVTFCFGGGMGFAFVPVQIRCQAPMSFDLLSLLIALAFSFVFVSNFISEKHPVAAGVLEFVGVLFAAAGLFTAICIPLPVMFKCVVWVIFAGSVLGISVVNIFLC